jgi:hypothetical protein
MPRTGKFERLGFETSIFASLENKWPTYTSESSPKKYKNIARKTVKMS